MGDKQVLQRGNKVYIDNKGGRTSRPLEDGEVEAQMRTNNRRFGTQLTDKMADASVGAVQRMPNRRDTVIDDAMGHNEGPSMTDAARARINGR